MKQRFTCSGCGVCVLKYLCQLTGSKLVFCTLDCRNKNYKKANPSWHPNNYKEYEHACKCCGLTFIKTGSRNRSNILYCGSSCRAKHYPRQPHTEETKNRLSIATTLQNKNYLSKHHYSGVNGVLVMKSSWEVKYALYLDSMGLSWVYEPFFKLSNGRAFLPDFQLSTGDIIEIKGYMREDAQKKWDLFCIDYPGLNKLLLRKEDMKKLGLI